MEPEDYNKQEVETNRLVSLKTVTPFSKYLAIALFILLPFVGGWVGYHFTPEKEVEVERKIYVQRESSDVDNVISDTLTEVNSAHSQKRDRNRYFSAYYGSSDIDLSLFSDQELGISFHYPEVWGDIATSSDGVIILSLKGFDRPWTDEGINIPFLSVSFQQGPSNLPRGPGWPDFAGLYDENYINDCKANEDCEVLTNEHGLLITKTLKPIDCFEGCIDARLHYGYEYGIFNENLPNQSVLMTSYAIEFELWSPEQVRSLFEKTIVKSFRFTGSN